MADKHNTFCRYSPKQMKIWDNFSVLVDDDTVYIKKILDKLTVYVTL